MNNSTAFSRQIFTLFHELAHILFDVSGVTMVDSSFIDRMTGPAGRIEVACNRFAAEVLLPEQAFPWEEFSGGDVEEPVARVAKRFHVSREVVLRRLLDAGRISRTRYQETVRAWNEEYQRRGSGTGGNYYATQAAYLGESYLKLAFSQLHAGNVTVPELATHLGIKAKNIGRLEEFLLSPINPMPHGSPTRVSTSAWSASTWRG